MFPRQFSIVTQLSCFNCITLCVIYILDDTAMVVLRLCQWVVGISSYQSMLYLSGCILSNFNLADLQDFPQVS